MNTVQGRIQQRQWPWIVKVLLVFMMHAYNFRNEVLKYRDGRPWTLYDHF